MINRIISEIKKKDSKVDGIIQHSYNPGVNDSIQFLVYSDNKIIYIVSTHRNPVVSRKILYSQNEIMNYILKKVKGTTLEKNILFSRWLLDLPCGCFRIQEFKKRCFYLQPLKYNTREYQKYHYVSCEFILKLQDITCFENPPESYFAVKEKIKRHISELKYCYSSENGAISLLTLLEKKIDVINTPMKIAVHHGDYCFWNFFVDTNNIHRVIDWEFAKKSEWVVIDYIMNLLVSWLILRKNNMINCALDTFFMPQDDIEKILSEKLHSYKSCHGFNDNEMKLYFVYVFLILVFRKERPELHLLCEPYLSDMIGVLNF